ncbi:MAG: amidase [Sporolactobacillus sp.]
MEILQQLWRRIDHFNPVVNALVTEDRAAALAAAKDSEKHMMAGEWRALEGVPIAIKDLTDTAGMRTTYGSLVYRDHVPEKDATIVARLKQAGAIIIGKTNTPEFGHKATTNNRLFGATRNPWKMSNGVGGSSGGSAAAVALGFCPLAEGSDGGGSIRIPAALCGVVGFKPSFGRIPQDNNRSDVFATTNPFVSYGPLARTVKDAALFFDAVSGPSLDDPFALDAPQQPVAEMLVGGGRKWRVGYTYDFGVYPLSQAIRSAFDGILEKMRATGADVQYADFALAESLDEYVCFFNRLWMIGLAEASVTLMQKHRQQLSPTLVNMIERGQYATAAECRTLTLRRTAIWRLFQRQFQQFDILVSPTLGAVQYGWKEEGPSAVDGIAISAESGWMMTSAINLTGEPACSLPVAQLPNGLPVGMQCVAARLHDRQLFQFAAWLEHLAGFQAKQQMMMQTCTV